MNDADLLICDSTLPWLENIAPRERRQQELNDRRSLGFAYVSLTVGGPYDRGDQVSRFAEEEAEWIASQSDRFTLARTVEDIRSAHEQGRLALGFHLQGTSPLDADASRVEAFYRLGIRHMLLAYNKRNPAGDGCMEQADEGLTPFGRAVVEEMNRVGMLVDCSHTGYRTSMDALSHSRSTVIFSHSNARALRDHPRNLPDDLIRACADQGGWIGVNGVARFLADPQDDSTDAFVRHLEYISELVGAQHVGIGLDHIFMAKERNEEVVAELSGGGWGTTLSAYDPPPPYTWVKPAQIARLPQTLLERGWSPSDVRGVMGENFLRVAESVWK